jgi:NAD(P)-dependent dehydrogenase (short-subunit alcohol dehydrogenase family)
MNSQPGRRLAGKVCLVTGGSSGIGQAAAIAFAREGARVVVADAELAAAEKAVRRAAVGEATAVRLDVTQPAAVRAAIESVAERHGRLDVLACVAGVALPEDGYVHETDPAVWERTFAVNVQGTFLCCKYGVLQMLRQGGGVIVNCASTAGLMPGVGAVYDASMTAVSELTRVIALHYGAENIRCNTVVPDGMVTPLPAHPTIRTLSERLGLVGPASRTWFARPEQIAPAFVFLASDDSSYLTGVDFPVHAGGP